MRTRDNRQRFLVESCDVRGQICHLDDTWREATARVDYPPLVREKLGETFVAALLLAGTVKFDGRMTLQIRGEGAIHLLVVQVSATGSVRGLARWGDLPPPDGTDEPPPDGTDKPPPDGTDEPPPDGTDGPMAGAAENDAAPAATALSTLFGDEARMVITIEAHDRGEPYQGIVPLEGETLSDALAGYFRNSEQLQTELYLSVDENSAAGMLLQRLPVEEREGGLARSGSGDDGTVHSRTGEADTDGWRRATALAGTLGGEELRERDVAGLLHTLFHEERVRLFEEAAVRFDCSCSRERTDGMLQGLGEAEVQSIIDERGSVEITCEFCDAEYRYDAVDAAALFHATPAADDVDAEGDGTVRH